MFNQDKCPSSPRLKAGASGPKSLVNATGHGGTYHPDDLEGEWWGPLTPPWEDEERKCCGKDTCKEDTEE